MKYDGAKLERDAGFLMLVASVTPWLVGLLGLIQGGIAGYGAYKSLGAFFGGVLGTVVGAAVGWVVAAGPRAWAGSLLCQRAIETHTHRAAEFLEAVAGIPRALELLEVIASASVESAETNHRVRDLVQAQTILLQETED